MDKEKCILDGDISPEEFLERINKMIERGEKENTPKNKQ